MKFGTERGSAFMQMMQVGQSTVKDFSAPTIGATIWVIQFHEQSP